MELTNDSYVNLPNIFDGNKLTNNLYSSEESLPRIKSNQKPGVKSTFEQNWDHYETTENTLTPLLRINDEEGMKNLDLSAFRQNNAATQISRPDRR